MSRLCLALLACAAAAAPAAAQEGNLYPHDDWAALASDRRASAVGDILTVIVLENWTAANSAQTGTRRDSRIGADLGISGTSLDGSANFGLKGGFEGAGQTSRSGRMVAQISVRVDSVYPNGDLGVSGEQLLTRGRERTNIRIRGRVRPADISASNTILSARLADAAIAYEGSGFVSRSAKPGLLQRIFSFLGIM